MARLVLFWLGFVRERMGEYGLNSGLVVVHGPVLMMLGLFLVGPRTLLGYILCMAIQD